MNQRGITLNGKHTYRDYGLRWIEPVEISPPVPKTSYVDIPGRKTPLDATESLYGSVTFENRTITLKFYKPLTYSQWLIFDSRLQNYLAGKAVKAVLDIEPDKYWLGRVTSITTTKPNSPIAEFQVVLTVEPFKYYEEEPDDEWLWDPFSFQYGVIRNLRNISVSGSKTQTIQGTEMPMTPTITATAAMTVRVDGVTYQLEANVPKKLTDVVIYRTSKSFYFSGTGSVTITFRGETL